MDNKPLDLKFDPPKLPFAWIASTFIAPTLIVVLPSVFGSEALSWAVRLAIGFALLAVLLLICAIVLAFRIYDYAYELQVLKINHNALLREAENIQQTQAQLTAISADLQASLQQFRQRQPEER